jgi:hypothetical protein
MRLISIYCLALAMTSLTALPPAAQVAAPLDGAALQGRSCARGIDRLDALIDLMTDDAGIRRAALELEMARNMMGAADYRSCATYIDNAARALTASHEPR